MLRCVQKCFVNCIMTVNYAHNFLQVFLPRAGVLPTEISRTLEVLPLSASVFPRHFEIKFCLVPRKGKIAMDDTEENVPVNADKLLFAEDLIRYVMQSYDVSFEISTRVDRFRNAVYNAFNDTVRVAVDFLTRQFYKSSSFKFEVLSAARMDTEGSFLDLAEHLREKFFSKGFDARRFLFYCAHLSSLAGTFYSFGIHTAPDIAAEAVARCIEDYPMQSGAWDTVNAIAVELSDMAANCDDSECPADSLVRDRYKTHSPKCPTPTSEVDTSEDEVSQDFEKEVLKTLSLDEFYGIDAEWKSLMLPLLSLKEESSGSDDSEETLMSE